MPIGVIPHVARRKIGERIYYFGSFTSDKAQALTFVPVVEESRKTYLKEETEDGYQRPGSLSRMRSFMKFLIDNPDHVVPPVVLSGRGSWKFKAYGEDDYKDYGTLEVHGPAAIIDGQHRIGGYVALYSDSKKDMEDHQKVRQVDFILIDNLSRDQEMNEFVTVNGTQQGVPKALTTYLGDTDEAQIAWELNERDDSPFKGRITRTTMHRPHLFALHSVAKQMKRMFIYGDLADLPIETKVDYVIRYWEIIADSRTEEWSDIEKLDDLSFHGRSDFEYKMLELTGLIAWSLIAEHILGRSFAEGVGMNWENVKRLVDAAGDIDWRKTGVYEGRTGEAGGSAIAKDMQRKIPAEAGPELE